MPQGVTRGFTPKARDATGATNSITVIQ